MPTSQPKAVAPLAYLGWTPIQFGGSSTVTEYPRLAQSPTGRHRNAWGRVAGSPLRMGRGSTGLLAGSRHTAGPAWSLLGGGGATTTKRRSPASQPRRGWLRRAGLAGDGPSGSLFLFVGRKRDQKLLRCGTDGLSVVGNNE